MYIPLHSIFKIEQMKKLIILITSFALMMSCMSHDLDTTQGQGSDVKENVKNIFGVEFYSC